jgi:hypothetical protein
MLSVTKVQLNTTYTSNESFTEIETEMLSLSNKYDCYTSLIGDMNAKTKLLEDVTVPDDSLFEIVAYSPIIRCLIFIL